MSKREVELLLKARDEASREIRNLRGELDKSERAAIKTNAAFSDIRRISSYVSVIGQLRIGVDAVNLGVKAMQGDWEGVRDVVFRLPFGLGRMAQSLNDVLGTVTGIREETERIERETQRIADVQDAVMGMKEIGRDFANNMEKARRDAERAMEMLGLDGIERERFTIALSLEIDKERLSAQAQAAASEIAKIAAKRSALQEQLTELQGIEHRRGSLRKSARGRRALAEAAERRREIDSQIAMLTREHHTQTERLEEVHQDALDSIRERRDRERERAEGRASMDRLNSALQEGARLAPEIERAHKQAEGERRVHEQNLRQERLDQLRDRMQHAPEDPAARRAFNTERINQEFDLREKRLKEIIRIEDEGSERRIAAEEKLRRLADLRAAAAREPERAVAQQQARGPLQAFEARFLTRRQGRGEDPNEKTKENTERIVKEAEKQNGHLSQLTREIREFNFRGITIVRSKLA